MHIGREETNKRMGGPDENGAGNKTQPAVADMDNAADGGGNDTRKETEGKERAARRDRHVLVGSVGRA